jgi:3-oxoadipate enol-lactonase
MQVFTDDGARIDASVDGARDADAVVLIHGFPLARTIWDAQAEVLARGWFVVCPDLRGSGTSSVPDGPYLMERLAADIAAVLDALGIARAALVGHSMGGYVALAFARMFTERVSRLALTPSRLVGDTPQQAAERRELARRVERDDDVSPVVESYVPRLFAATTVDERPELVERAVAIARRTAPHGAAGALRGMALRASGEDIAEDLEVPMLMLAGACDAVVRLDEAGEIARRFPQGRLTVCDRSGHLPMLEEPDCVTEALLSWLAS